jgi:hypothetical protein
MGAICEALGLAWPGSTSIPAGDPRHLDVARRVGARIVALVQLPDRRSRSSDPRIASTTRLTYSARSADRPTPSSTSRRWRDVSDSTSTSTRSTASVATSRCSSTSNRRAYRVDGRPRRRRRRAHRLRRARRVTARRRDCSPTVRSMAEVQSQALAPKGAVHERSDPVDAERCVSRGAREPRARRCTHQALGRDGVAAATHRSGLRHARRRRGRGAHGNRIIGVPDARAGAERRRSRRRPGYARVGHDPHSRRPCSNAASPTWSASPTRG